MSRSRCFIRKAPQDGGPPLFQHGNVIFQAHYVGWIVTGFFTTIATVTSIWLVNRHLKWYTNKQEQRYIVRLLFMVPIYATISFASYLFWNHHTPLLLIRDGYESTVLTAFFYLLLSYLSPNADEQRAIILKVGLSRQADREARRLGHAEAKWMFPLGFIKWKPEDGLYFLQIMKWGILQYCVIRPLTTLAAVTLDYVGLYCENSWAPKWGHPYITVIVSISVSVAMYCLVQLYVPISTHIAHHKPLLKLFAIKAVVFLTFWQATLLGLLSTFGVVKDTPYMTADDINIGFGAILETAEMTAFAFLHVKAFSYKPYRTQASGSIISKPISRMRALGHAMDFRETFREIWLGMVYLIDRIHGREPKPDKGARRTAHLKEAFGKDRPSLFVGSRGHPPQDTKFSRRQLIEVEVEERVDVDVGGERQWLGIGDDYAYGLGYVRREKSEGLGAQISKELQRRGLELSLLDPETRSRNKDEDMAPDHKRQTTWWRNIYNRISRSSSEHSIANLSAKPSKRRFHSRSSRDIDHESLILGQDYDEPPPSSTLRVHNNERQGASDNDKRLRRYGRNQTVRVSPSVEERHLNTMPTLAFPPKQQAFAGTDHQTATPLQPLLLPLGERFAHSVTDHDVLITQGHYYESELGELRNVPEICNSPHQTQNVVSDLPPPVPPKSKQDTEKCGSAQPSHLRGAQQLDAGSPPRSPIIPLCPSPASARGPNHRPRPPRSSRPVYRSTLSGAHPASVVSIDQSPIPHREPDQISQRIERNSYQPAWQTQDASRTYNASTRRPRQYSSPVPVTYAVPTHPQHSYQRPTPRRVQLRTSAPLERIPQHSVPVNLGSQSHHERSSYPEIRESNKRYPRRPSHAPRIPIMPELLAHSYRDPKFGDGVEN